MQAIGYTVEGQELICIDCSGNSMYNLATEPVYADGYPDGYTCSDCGDTYDCDGIKE